MTRFRFRYDARGRELPRQTDGNAKGTATPHQMTDRDHAERVIAGLRNWIQAHPSLGLDMQILEERGVLLTPPHWNYVSNITGDVQRTAPSGVSVEDERDAIRKYYDMLQGRQPQLDEALAAASYASVASLATDPATQMRDALKALPSGGTALPPIPEIANILPTPSLRTADAESWAAAILQRHVEMRGNADSVQRDWKALEQQAWDRWKIAFQHFRSGTRASSITIDDILLRTRRIGPAALFRDDLGAMTVREWSAALRTAAPRDPSSGPATPVPEWAAREVGTYLLAGKRTLLTIVGASATSPTALWLPSQQHACLWIDRGEWRDTGDTLFGSGEGYFDGERWFLVLEVAGNPELVRDVPSKLVTGPLVLPARTPLVAYLGQEKLPGNVTPRIPYIENVRNVDEAIARLESLTRKPSPENPPV